MTDNHRREKKSESLEVRLPHSQKQAFMKATKSRDETASDAIRRYIEAYILETKQVRSTHIKDVTMTVSRNPFKSLAIVASSAAAAITFGALPSAADDSAFSMLDKNQDGALTVGEIAEGHDAKVIEILDTDKSGGVSLEEFKSQAKVVKLKSETSGPMDGETSGTKKVSVIQSTDGDLRGDLEQALQDGLPSHDEQRITELANTILEYVDDAE